jgi:hypothetical protein
MRKTLFFLLIVMSFGVASAGSGDMQTRSDVVMFTLQQLNYQQLITPDQLNAYLQGAEATEVYLTDGRNLDGVLKNAEVVGVAKWTVDAGGGAANNGAFMIKGTAGQPDAGLLTGDYDLFGGFWGEAQALFIDGFESGDTSRWSTTVQ